MVYRLGFVTVSAIALIILNAFAFKLVSTKYSWNIGDTARDICIFSNWKL